MSPLKKTWTFMAGAVSCVLMAVCVPSDKAQAGSVVQILHASDLEGGVEAIANAPNFAAIIDRLEEEYETTLILSAGDNYILGPFFSASGDESMREAFRSVLGNPDVREGAGRVDVSIMNLIGFHASAFGNHEFDAGTAVVAELLGTDIVDADGDAVLDEAAWLGARFPYLSANLDFSGDENLSGLFTRRLLDSNAFHSSLDDLEGGAAAPGIARAAVVEQNGQRFGVVGATTPLLESISSPGKVKVENPGAGTEDMDALASILQPVIDELLERGIDKIILSTHLQQISLEEELITKLRGVDIVLAGGSDTLLADEEDVARRLRPGDAAEGDYPVVTVNADGEPAMVVSTDGEYTYVGRLVVEFDDKGVLIAESVDSAVSGVFATTTEQVEALWGSLDRAFSPGTKGARVQALVKAVQRVVKEKDSAVLGLTDVFLNGLRADVRTQETNLGDLTADANLAAARRADPAVRASLKNGGGIRSSIGEVVEAKSGAYEKKPPRANPLSGKKEGGISRLDVENSLRFNNKLTLLTVTAEQLLKVVEHGVAETGPGETPGRFPQIGGMAFSFDAAKPAGERVASLALLDEAGRPVETVVENGQVTGDPRRPIRLVTLNFLAGGGDGYPFDTFGTDVVELETREQTALGDYLTANFSVNPVRIPDVGPDLDERIQNLSARGDTVLATLEPDIKVNNQDLPAVGDSTTSFSITYSLGAGNREGRELDWWLIHRSPQGWMTYDESEGWSPEIRPVRQMAVSDQSSLEVYNGVLSSGTHLFYFGLDSQVDGMLKLDGSEQVWFDFVEVHVD